MNQFRQLVEHTSYSKVILGLVDAQMTPSEGGSRSAVPGYAYYKDLAELIIEFARQQPDHARRSLPPILKYLDENSVVRCLEALPTKKSPRSTQREPV